MTSTVLQQPMAWTNEKFRLTCVDNIGFRQLWKLIALDSNNNNNNSNSNTITTTTTDSTTINTNNNINSNSTSSSDNKENNIILDNENLAEFLTNRDQLLPPNKMSLLKFLAINALELSAPATPVLLQQSNNNNKPNGWMQLSGHPESIIPTAAGIVRKRISEPNDTEVIAYQQLSSDNLAKKLIPKFLGVKKILNDNYIELQDLLYGFKDPNVMDIKMGRRTFLESEVINQQLRNDLYKKMILIDNTAPTIEEHQKKAITKLRYMLFREEMSSSQEKGFRIDALRLRGSTPITDLKTIRTTRQIEKTIQHFLNNNYKITKELIKRLKTMKTIMEKSEFFNTHEVVGSSIFIVYDDDKCGIWLIDFAKSHKLPDHINIDHRKEWIPGNYEEGLLYGMDQLINVFETVYESQLNDIKNINTNNSNNRR